VGQLVNFPLDGFFKPDDPVSNSGVSPIQPSPSYGPEKPRLASGEETQEPKPFSLGPEGKPAQETQSQRPSPMEVAGDAARQHPQIPPEQLSEHILKLQEQYQVIQNKIQQRESEKSFTADHYSAMQKITQKLNPDMQTIAKNTSGEFNPPVQKKGQSVVDHIANWINGSQGTLQNALEFLQTEQKPDPASYLRLQYAVQRATQRGELFASIVGSTVSGIKTIMSTQLG
jgi:hypothetical protein